MSGRQKSCTILVGQQHMESGVVFSKDQVYTFLPLKCSELIKTMHLKPKPACHQLYIIKL